MARGVYLAFASIQCFFNVSIPSDSPDFISAGCKAVTLGKLRYSHFTEKKVET